uniref:Uncharacterized protein n=1 Tax=Ditylum brightwellii TaxID=49249 RepID=A0A7S4RQQ2_9STRA
MTTYLSSRRKQQQQLDEKEDGKILIVLDDVYCKEDLYWFQFDMPADDSKKDEEDTEKGTKKIYCDILTTTKLRSLTSSSRTIVTHLLSEKESLSLLMTEASLSRDHVASTSDEAKDIVRKCAYHPLAVRSVGRWMGLKYETAGVVNSVEEIHQDVYKCMQSVASYEKDVNELSQQQRIQRIRQGVKKNEEEKAPNLIYAIMNHSLSPALDGKSTNLIKFCFAAFVTVFCKTTSPSSSRSCFSLIPIPTETAYEFFQKIVETEERLLSEGERAEDSFFQSSHRKDAIMLITEALAELGVFHIINQYNVQEDDTVKEEAFIQINHDIQIEYGDYLSMPQPSSNSFSSVWKKLINNDSEKKWNNTYVSSFYSLKQQCSWNDANPDGSHVYALSHMPTHMLRAKRIKECCTLLRNEFFIRGRIYSMGFQEAVDQHVSDVEALYEEMLNATVQLDLDEPNDVMQDSYEKLADAIKRGKKLHDLSNGVDFDESDHSSAAATTHENRRCTGLLAGTLFHRLAYSLAQKNNWAPAIGLYRSSENLISSELGEETEIVASILYSMGWIFFEMDDYEKSASALKDCLYILNALRTDAYAKTATKSFPLTQIQFRQELYKAKALAKLGEVMAIMSEYDSAIEYYEKSFDILKKEPNRNRMEMSMVLHGKGLAYYWKNGEKEDLEQAMKCFEQSLRFKQVILGFSDIGLASTYEQMGNVMVEMGETSAAVPLYDEALRIIKQVELPTQEQETDIMTMQGALCCINGYYDKGISLYSKITNIMKRKMGYQEEKVACIFNLMAKAYEKIEEHRKACKMYEECLKLRKSAVGSDHLKVASTLYDMALMFHKRGKPTRALACLEESRRIRIDRLGSSVPVAETLQQLGNISKFAAQYGAAINFYEGALAMRKELHGESHESVADVLQEMGDLMDDLGEYETAMNKFGDCLYMRKRRLGEKHEDVASVLYAMGFTLLNKEEYERSMSFFEEALTIRIDVFGVEHSLVGDTYNIMGFIEAKREELDKALVFLMKAYQIRGNIGETLKASDTLKNIGNVHREQCNLKEAVDCYEDSLRMRRSELGDKHDKVADALISLGTVRYDMSLHDSAMANYKEALEIRRDVYGDFDDRVASVQQNIGIMQFRAGNLTEAKHHLDEFVKIRRVNKTKESADYVNILFMIGNINRINGYDTQAKAAWSEALEIFKHIGLAKENPELARTLDNLLESPDPAEKQNTVIGKISVNLLGEK